MIAVCISAEHGNSKKRVRARNYCNFCDDTVVQLPRHFRRHHSELPEVSEVLSKKEGKERSLGFLKLRNLGNFKHNIAVLDSGFGTLRVSKRSNRNSKVAEDYLPCVHCLAFYCKDQLWRHVLHCPLNSEKLNASGEEDVDGKRRASCSAAGQILLDGSLLNDSQSAVDAEFKASVIDKMHKDEIRRVAVADSLIASFGHILYQRLGPQRAQDIQQRMRQLARLLQAVNTEVPSPYRLTDVISGKGFDLVINGVHSAAGMNVHDSGRRVFSIPSLASKLGHSIKKCAQLKLGQGIRQDDPVMQHEAQQFLTLHRADWQDKVSTVCGTSFKLSKINKAEELPSREDLDKLKEFQACRMHRLNKELLQCPSYESWRELCKLTLSRVTLFNKRRGGEASQLLVSHYLNRPNWQEKSHAEVTSSLLPVERELLKRMDMIQIPGKRLNTVHILLTPDCKTAMDTLLQTRTAVGIPHTNPYFFPSFSENGHLDPCHVIQRVVKLAGVKNPARITTTKLRKYIATMMQLLDLTQNELDWVSKHLGHSLNIHKFYYRQHTSAIEMGKVARLLLQVEEGQSADYSGKSLDQITLQGKT